MSEEDKKKMDIANCRICTLCQNHCADCPLNWALKFIELADEWIEANPFEAMESLWLSTIEE